MRLLFAAIFLLANFLPLVIESVNIDTSQGIVYPGRSLAFRVTGLSAGTYQMAVTDQTGYLTYSVSYITISNSLIFDGSVLIPDVAYTYGFCLKLFYDSTFVGLDASVRDGQGILNFPSNLTGIQAASTIPLNFSLMTSSVVNSQSITYHYPGPGSQVLSVPLTYSANLSCYEGALSLLLQDQSSSIVSSPATDTYLQYTAYTTESVYLYTAAQPALQTFYIPPALF